MIPVIKYVTDGIFTINPSAAEELLRNNCTMPDVQNVVYNLKTEDTVKDQVVGNKIKVALDRAILTTVVFFVDGTKAVVQNSANDTVKIVAQKLSDGSTVLVADRESKERGLIYAILKRYVSEVDSKGVATGGALGSILKKIVDASHDSCVKGAQDKINQTVATKRHEELKATAKPKVKRFSIADSIARFNAIMDKIDVFPGESTSGGCGCQG